MLFQVSALGKSPGIYLVPDNWNDWFQWVTQFTAYVVDELGSTTILGSVKIGQKGMGGDRSSTRLPPQFESLDETYFSLGQTENYFETLAELGDEFRVSYLKALRDCAFNLDILDANASEPVMTGSLLRDKSVERVRRRLHRLAHGDAALSRFTFEYQFPTAAHVLDPPPALTFDVRPDVLPPTNVHVLIGRNGVGKSRCFDLLTRTLLGLDAGDEHGTGSLKAINQPTSSFLLSDEQSIGFASLVTVAFSAFDSSRPFSAEQIGERGIRYAYVGLKKLPEAKAEAAADADQQPRSQHDGKQEAELVFPLKTHGDLAREFVESVAKCRAGVRLRRWNRALETLEADPLFKEVDVSALARIEDDTWKIRAFRMFRKLSSGHGIVLLTITRLVELVEERSLVLLDEPEGHLHPPLLSAFVRALSDLLTQRNGVALVATHSPVVLQEVPQECVWVLSRTGRSSRADRPEIETFGENVGVLTREVFGLEVTHSGFHKMIADAASELQSYDLVIERFGGKLGAEARGLARALVLAPPPKDNVEE